MWARLLLCLLCWGLYVIYEWLILPDQCTGECNIRIDLFFIYPVLMFITIWLLVIPFFYTKKDPSS